MQTVITGMGIWSCIGHNLTEVEQSLRQGHCGIYADVERKKMGYQSCLTGKVDMPFLSFEKDLYSARGCLTEATKYAYMAMTEALSHRRFTQDEHSRCALIVSCDSSAAEVYHIFETMEKWHDTRALGAKSVFRTLNSTVSMNLARLFGIGGLTFTVSAACAGGGHAIGLAHKLIQRGIVRACIVVGAQEVNPYAFLSFDTLGIFSRKENTPSCASLPFDRNRDGLVPSGGAACVIIEGLPEYEDASNVTCLCDGRESLRIEGYGFNTTNTLCTPCAEDEYDAMRMALSDARVDCRQLDFVIPHATGTVDGDREEAQALISLEQRHCPERKLHLPVVCTKNLTGHECWMAGVSQVVYAALQMRGRFLAPYPGYASFDPECGLENINLSLQEKVSLHYALCNAFGFGGTNASLVLSYY